MAGILAGAGAALEVLANLVEFSRRVGEDQVPAPVLQYPGDRSARHDRHPDLMYAGRLWILALSHPRQRSTVYDLDFDDLLADGRDHRAHIYLFCKDWLGRHLAAADCA